MEQSAFQGHLVDVTDCFLAVSQIRASLVMVWPGLCLTILLCFARFSVSRLTLNASFIL